MTRAPKILILTPWFPERRGGCYLYILDQIEALIAEGIDIDVIVLQANYPRWFRALRFDRAGAGDPDVSLATNFQLRVVRCLRLPGRVFSALREPVALLNSARVLRTQIGDTPYDLIHAHTEVCGYMATRIASELKIASVVTLHGTPQEDYLRSRTRRSQFRKTLTLASRTILVGDPLLEPFRQIADQAKFEVILNGYSLPEGVRPSRRLPRHRSMRIVSVSNLVSSKGVDITLLALDELARNGTTDIEYVIVGDGPEKAGLQALACKLGLADRTFFTGRLTHMDAMEEVLAADVFCLPSWREACGIAYLEAMALGKAAIGCRNQGPSQFISHGTTGLLVEPRSPHSVAEILATIRRQPSLCKAIGRAAAQIARTRFSWSANAKKVIAMYQEISLAFGEAAVREFQTPLESESKS